MGEKLVLLRSIVLRQSSAYEEVEVDGITDLEGIYNGVEPCLEASILLDSVLGVEGQLTALCEESLVLGAIVSWCQLSLGLGS